MQGYKGRSVSLGQRVRVYRNLHRNGEFSIMDAKTGLVLVHGPVVLLANVRYHVNKGGRLRVLRDNKKYVHAWVEGDFVRAGGPTEEEMGSVPWGVGFYNPRKTATFCDPDTHEVLDGDYTHVWCNYGVTYYPRADGVGRGVLEAST
jgi:hypothetical protein